MHDSLGYRLNFYSERSCIFGGLSQLDFDTLEEAEEAFRKIVDYFKENKAFH